MTNSNIEWTLTFGEEKVHDGLARLVDEITPGLIDRLATDPTAYAELITASELVATRAEGLLAETVLSARHAGLTWAQVGKALGIDARLRSSGLPAPNARIYGSGSAAWKPKRTMTPHS